MRDQGAGNEGVNQRVVDLDFEIFHLVRTGVFVEFFRGQKASMQRIVCGLLGESPHGVFQVTMGRWP